MSLIPDNLELDIEISGDCLFAIVRGPMFLDTALGVSKQVIDAAAKHQLSRILVDTLRVEGVLTTMELYRLAVEVVAHAERRETNPKIAIVGRPPTSDQFCVRVAQNRGLTTEMFPTRGDALLWLEAFFRRSAK